MLVFKHSNGLIGELIAKTEGSLIVRTHAGICFEDRKESFFLVSDDTFEPFDRKYVDNLSEEELLFI
jgi:hypothetical protein